MLLIVGANGFVGRGIAAHFRAEGLPFRTASHRAPADVILDFADMEGVIERIHRLGVRQAVICSGITDIDRCRGEPEVTWKFNVLSVVTLAGKLREHGIDTIFCSSDMVFGDGREGWRECDEPNPGTEYGWQKRAVEEALRLNGGDWAVLRMSKLYALEPSEGSLVHQALDALKAGRNLRAATDQVVVPTLVTDVARTVAAIATRRLTGIFHLTPKTRYSRYDFARFLAARIGAEAQVTPCSIDDLPLLEKRPKALWLDGAETAKATGVKPLELADVLDDILTRAALPVPVQGAA